MSKKRELYYSGRTENDPRKPLPGEMTPERRRAFATASMIVGAFCLGLVLGLWLAPQTPAEILARNEALEEELASSQKRITDLERTLRQHAAYRQALESSGVVTNLLDADLRYPDGCFIEDTAVVAGGLAVIARPGAPSRLGEEHAIADLMACRTELARIVAPGTLDGGDVLVTGKDILVGLSSRTNAAGIEQLAVIASAISASVTTI